MKHIHYIRTKHKIYEDIRTYCPSSEGASGEGRQADNNRRQQAQLLQHEGHHQGGYHDPRTLRQGGGISGDKKMPGDAYWETSRSAILTSHSTKSSGPTSSKALAYGISSKMTIFAVMSKTALSIACLLVAICATATVVPSSRKERLFEGW